MDIDCPECEKNIDLDNHDLPQCACDYGKVERDHCEHVFNVGWYATAELR